MDTVLADGEHRVDHAAVEWNAVLENDWKMIDDYSRNAPLTSFGKAMRGDLYDLIRCGGNHASLFLSGSLIADQVSRDRPVGATQPDSLPLSGFLAVK
jgi:hypothetical protein